MLTRQTFLARVRSMSDTLSATTDYPDALLNDFASLVHVDEWRKLLDLVPYYRTARRTVTLDSNGRFLWTALASGTGNGVQTPYRVLELADAMGDTLVYAQPDRVRTVGPRGGDQSDKLWTRVGAEIQTYGASGALSVLVNWTPVAAGELASDADFIDFPDPYAPVLFYETAAMALEVGGRETSEAMALRQSAEMMRQKMLASLRRESAQPWVLGAADDPWDWGGL